MNQQIKYIDRMLRLESDDSQEELFSDNNRLLNDLQNYSQLKQSMLTPNTVKDLNLTNAFANLPAQMLTASTMADDQTVF